MFLAVLKQKTMQIHFLHRIYTEVLLLSLDLHCGSPFSYFECKSRNLSSAPLSLNAGLIPPVSPCPLFSCIPTSHVFIKLNKMHVCFTCRPLNKGIDSFIRTQSVRFSPAKLSGRTAFPRRFRSFSLVTALFIPLTSNQLFLPESRD